jgi:photosystem II stability/assembly factor-like uncharacterized protein
MNVIFTDRLHGWVTANTWDYGCLKTVNGGNTWSYCLDSYLFGSTTLFFINNNIGWVASENGYIKYTIDGGINWTDQTSGTWYSLNGIHFENSSTGWIVGDYGTIIKTTNGGKNWNSKSSGTTENLYGVSFVNENTGWISGSNGTIKKTTNGGTTWTSQATGTAVSLFGLQFIDANYGYACGGTESSGIILRTTNGGTNWTLVNVSPMVLYRLSFAGKYLGWTAGNSGLIYRTTNGGIDWIADSLPAVAGQNGIYFVDANTGWAVGPNGYIFKGTYPIQQASPLNNSTCLDVATTFNWYHYNSLSTYHLQVANSPDFSNLVIDQTNIADTTLTPILGYSRLYYWRVRPVIGSTEKDWSSIWSFSTVGATLGYNISGTVKYKNTGMTTMKNITLYLLDTLGNYVSTTKTSSTGTYTFTCVSNGSYIIKAYSDKAWGGLNTADVSLTRQKIAFLANFIPIQNKAADVNLSNTVNTQDVVLMRQKIAFLNPAQWLAPNFVFEDPIVIVNGANVTCNFYSLCAGDVNGSFTPQ